MLFLSKNLTLPSSFFFYFAHTAVLHPYLITWFTLKGLSVDQGSVIIAAATFFRVLISFPISFTFIQLNDHALKRVLLLLAFLCCFLLFMVYGIDFFYLLLLLFALYQVCVVLINAIIDSYAVSFEHAKIALYAHTRLWGSIGYLSAVIFFALANIEITSFNLFLLSFLFLLVFAGCVFFLPSMNDSLERSQRLTAFSWSMISSLFSNKVFLLVAISSLLIISSHAPFYVFSVIYWRDSLHFSPTSIAFLWSFSVILEILFFRFSQILFPALKNIYILLILACVGTFIRWCGTFYFSSLYAMFIMQGLHAFSFASTHLACIGSVSIFIPKNLRPSSLTLIDGLNQLTSALITLLAGYLYGLYGGWIFLFSSALPLTAFLFIQFFYLFYDKNLINVSSAEKSL